jgi:hypothetical protein
VGGCGALVSGPSARREGGAVEWRALGELQWRGWKASDSALVQCREQMAAGWAGGERSGSVAMVEHVAPTP